MRIKTPREKKVLFLKSALRWMLYCLLIFFAFVYMTSGTSMKPIILLPIALCISVYNEPVTSAVTGTVCGFLTDISCGKLFGYNAVVFTIFCVLLSLLFDLYLKRRFFNIFVTASVLEFIHGWLDYRFYYGIWNYDNVDLIFRDMTVPVWIYTVIATVFVYLIIKMINHFLLPKEHVTLEEAIRTE